MKEEKQCRQEKRHTLQSIENIMEFRNTKIYKTGNKAEVCNKTIAFWSHVFYNNSAK